MIEVWYRYETVLYRKFCDDELDYEKYNRLMTKLSEWSDTAYERGLL